MFLWINHETFFELDPFGEMSFCLSFFSPDCERVCLITVLFLLVETDVNSLQKKYRLFSLVWFLNQIQCHHYIIKKWISLWATLAFDDQSWWIELHWWNWTSMNWYSFWSIVQDDKLTINKKKLKFEIWKKKALACYCDYKNKKLFQCNDKRKPYSLFTVKLLKWWLFWLKCLIH